MNADEQLFEIRRLLWENGFAKEAQTADRYFYDKNKKRGKQNNYIPAHERWKND